MPSFIRQLHVSASTVYCYPSPIAIDLDQAEQFSDVNSFPRQRGAKDTCWMAARLYDLYEICIELRFTGLTQHLWSPLDNLTTARSNKGVIKAPPAPTPATCTCFHIMPKPGSTCGGLEPSHPFPCWVQHHCFFEGDHAPRKVNVHSRQRVTQHCYERS